MHIQPPLTAAGQHLSASVSCYSPSDGIAQPSPAPARPLSPAALTPEAWESQGGLSFPTTYHADCFSCSAFGGKENYPSSPTHPAGTSWATSRGHRGSWGPRVSSWCAALLESTGACPLLAACPWRSSLLPEAVSGLEGTRQMDTDPTAVSQGKRPPGSHLGEISHQHPHLFGCEL